MRDWKEVMQEVDQHRKRNLQFQLFARKMADAVTIGIVYCGGVYNCPLGYLVGLSEPFAETAHNLLKRVGLPIDEKDLQFFINGFVGCKTGVDPDNRYYILGWQYRELYRKRGYNRFNHRNLDTTPILNHMHDLLRHLYGSSQPWWDSR